MESKNDKLELVRLKYKYRELILKKKVRLSHKKAAKLIGPDCAYHLYSGFSSTNKKLNDTEPGK